MNFFEQELRRMTTGTSVFKSLKTVFIGRACFVPLSDGRRARMEFTTGIVAEHYEILSITIPQLCMATTEQAAEYFNVSVEAIRQLVRRNKDELEANGSVVYSQAQFEEQKLQNVTSVRESKNSMMYMIDDCVFQVNNRGMG